MALTKVTGNEIESTAAISAQSFSVSGVSTVGSLSIGNTSVINSAFQLQNIASLDSVTTATIESAISNAPNTFTDLSISGVSTFTNGPVLIGSGTSTGTAGQVLQVTGGAYVGGSVGIGVTTSGNKLRVNKDLGTNDYFGVAQHQSQFQIGRVSDNKSLEFAVLDNGTSIIQSKEQGVGYNNLAIQVNSNLGVGLTNPAQKLDVNGNIKVSGGGLRSFGYYTDGSSPYNVVVGTTGNVGYLQAINVGSASQLTIDGSPITFRTGSFAEAVRIDSSGNLLVGSASSTGTSSQPLQVTGGAYVSGKLGVGNTNPAQTIDVYTASAGMVLSSSTITNSTVYRATNGGGTLYYGLDDSTGANFGAAYGGTLWHTGAYPLIFGTSGTERLRLDSSGNLGIGTINPPDKLAVLGRIQIQQDASSNNRIVFRGQPTSLYRWSIDNFGSANDFRIFREDDTTTANGATYVAISTAGNFQFNSGYGSAAVAYGCRAWVNFNGTTASPSTIRASGNVSSVTKNGTGDYTVNFTTAMVDTNYSAVGTSWDSINNCRVFSHLALNAGSYRLCVVNLGYNFTDSTIVTVAIFR